MKLEQFSFCESVAAGGGSKWHLRLLTSKGKCLGGGIDTPSLCGHVKVKEGWDLAVDVTTWTGDETAALCSGCLREFAKLIKE